MSYESSLPILNHDLAPDERAWVQAVYADFTAACASADQDFNPKEVLREILGREKHRLPTPIDCTGNGPWRGGRNQHGRGVAAVFLPEVELHTHNSSRTDQFPMYVIGEADAFSLDEAGRPVLTPVVGGGQFHNPPGAPHALVPKVGRPIPGNWEIAFIAITPRNLQEDTHRVSDDVRAAYQRVVGREAPATALRTTAVATSPGS